MAGTDKKSRPLADSSFWRTELLSATALEGGKQDRRTFMKVCGAACGLAASGELPAAVTAEKSSKSRLPAELVQFGQTDLKVTRYCQGTAFRDPKVGRSDNPAARSILHACLDVGINFFDSAEAYGWGGSEMVLGKVIQGRRDDVVICTKAAPSRAPNDPNKNKFKLGDRVTFTRETLRRKVEGSLKRLGTDYIDLYLLHQPDEADTPPEELAESLNALVQAGKIRYWGVSNFPASHVQKFFELDTGRKAQFRIAGTEDYFNIVARDVLKPDLIQMLRQTQLGLMAFSPQDTGRLAPGRKISKAMMPVVRVLEEVARDLNATRPQVTIAWVLSHPVVTSCLGGAESPAHVKENFSGTHLVLPVDAVAKLNAVSDVYLQYKLRKQRQKNKS